MGNDTEKSRKLFTPLTILASVIFLAAIASNFYFFYFKRDYGFIVETACNPLQEICFQRDCSNLDDCPPNGLSDFKRYSLNAADFKMCINEDCTEACTTGSIKCEQVSCEPNLDSGESCSLAPNSDSE